MSIRQQILKEFVPDIEEFDGVDEDGDDLIAEVGELGYGEDVDQLDEMEADEKEFQELQESLYRVNDDDDDDDEDDDSQDSTPEQDSAKLRTKNANFRYTNLLARAQEREKRIQRVADDKLRREALGFTYPIKLRTIVIEPTSDSAWILDAKAARVLYDPDAKADELIISKTILDGIDVAPPAGQKRVANLPSSFDSIKFEPFMLCAPQVSNTNTVATFHTGLLPDLYSIVKRSTATSLDPKRFAALLSRGSLCDGTVLLFPSGSAVCTGPKGPTESRVECMNFVTRLTQMCIPARLNTYLLQNVVSNAQCGFHLDLNGLARAYPLQSQFDPKKFPGLIFRIDSTGRSVAIFFKSGCVILTGFRTHEDTRVMWTWLFWNVLRPFRMDSNQRIVSEREYRRLHKESNNFIDLTCEVTAQVAEQRAMMDIMMLENGPAKTKGLLMPNKNQQFSQPNAAKRRKTCADHIEFELTNDYGAMQLITRGDHNVTLHASEFGKSMLSGFSQKTATDIIDHRYEQLKHIAQKSMYNTVSEQPASNPTITIVTDDDMHDNYIQ